MLMVFGMAIFAGATLLFLVQPLVARLVLPLFGGSPAVWNTAMLFFQTLLLGGYLYAHLLTTRTGRRTQVIVHSAVLLAAIVALPIGLPGGWTPDPENPVVSVLVALGLVAGLPFFVVSSGGPLLQRWFSGTGHHRAHDPYFLYAASNAGSLIGLLGYPLLIEPRATLAQQAWIWSIGYGVFAIFAIASGVALLRSARHAAIPASPMAAGVADAGAEAELEEAAERIERHEPADPVPSRVGWRVRGKWLALAFIPSSLMLGVTQHISTDLAAVPLLWVIPLSLYLVSFIIAFSRVNPLAMRVAGRAMPVLTVAVVVAFLMDARSPLGAIVFMHLLLLALVAMVCHGRLAAGRPSASHLTEFYLCMSVGGALGGLFNAIVAPLVFDRVLEYPIVIALAGLALPAWQVRGKIGAAIDRVLRPRWMAAAVPIALGLWALSINRLVESWVTILGINAHQVLIIGVGAIVAYVTSLRPRIFAGVCAVLLAFAVFVESYSSRPDFITRTFFGVHAVGTTETQRKLWHGTTLHGVQWLDADRRDEPLSYYHREGPAGDVFEAVGPRAQRIALIGLGSGSLAAYGRPGQRFDIYEIDAAIVKIAENPAYFTYLSDTEAAYEIILGDGRLNLADRPEGIYDLLVIDAFSSDAIPVHLLTREAFELYASRLTDDGVLMVHISNRHLELAPVVASIAADLGLSAYLRDDSADDAKESSGRWSSDWAALAKNRAALAGVRSRPGWKPMVAEEGFRTWTDDYSSILTVLEFD
ncbi:MAG: fused MFS/spermidine synthase [Phycisphaerales bacterium JB037]